MYAQMMDAYDSGDAERVAQAGTALERRVKGCAKDIRDKYVCPPATTDFAIMFLPTRACTLRLSGVGCFETLSRDYKVNITGPSTMAALLNSLQMGFRTLAIQSAPARCGRCSAQSKTEFWELPQGARKRAGPHEKGQLRSLTSLSACAPRH
jgi:DNA recombination protein RmuC